MRAKINLYNSDCLPVMRKMADNQFSLAICDPPYGINRDFQISTICKNSKHNRKAFDKKGWDSKSPDNSYFSELFRVSENQIIWGANYFTEYLPKSMGWIFWDKGQNLTMSDGELAFTSFNVALRRKIINRVELSREGTIHPTQKPVALYKWLLKNYAKPGDNILDTHFGSLSIGIACWDAGYDLDAYEIDKDYFEAGKKRLENHKTQLQIY